MAEPDGLVPASAVRRLLADEMWESAELLSGLLVAAADESTMSEALVLHGDALSGSGQHRRALEHYRSAQARAPWQPAVKLREARCHVALSESQLAIAALESVPSGARTAAALLLLGRLYRTTGLKSKSLSAYKEALKLEPLALEAVQPLVELGLSKDEIGALTRHGAANAAAADDTAAAAPSAGQLAWLGEWSGAYDALHRHDPPAALQRFGRLAVLFPNNAHLLAHQGVAHQLAGNLEEAAYNFAKARVADALAPAAMGRYAVLLRQRGKTSDLHMLAHDLLGAAPHRPEAWLAVALDAEARGDIDKALSFADRAVALDPRHALAHQIRGELLLMLGQPDKGVMSFFTANHHAKTLGAFRGLLDAHLSTDPAKPREALLVAKDAVASLPRCAGALALLGRAFAAGGDVPRAARAFEKALEIDPSEHTSAIALADLRGASGDWHAAAAVLTAALERRNHDALHSKLADVHARLGQYGDALTFYHTAISLNADNADAVEGLAKLTGLMSGSGGADDFAAL